MRTHDKKAERLGEIELFRNCRPRDLKLLASIVDDLSFEAGEVMCEEGRVGNECYVIASGTAEVLVDGQPVALVGPGDVVGEMAILDGGQRAASVVAVTEAHAYSIGQRRFDDLLEQAPTVARAMLEQLSIRLRHVDEKLAATRSEGDG
jgi:CRP/FNR family transcriptional regulator, cyclic AMP receptor protein